MHLTIKNYRSCASVEGDAFSCTLYLDGKRAALVKYDGWGGPYAYDFTPSDKRPVGGATYDRTRDHVGALPPLKTAWDDRPLPQSMDMVVEAAISDMLEARQIKRWCKRNNATVFRLPSDNAGSWRILDAPFTKTMEQHVRTTYGGRAVFANTRFFGAAE